MCSAFCLLKILENELLTAVKMRVWSLMSTDLVMKSSKRWIRRSWAALLCQWKCILSDRSALLARRTILGERRLIKGVFKKKPLGMISRDLHLVKKVMWLRVLARRIFGCSKRLKTG